MTKPTANDGTVRRGYRLGRLGLSLAGSYLGYQAQNLWLGEDGRAARAARLRSRASGRVREELGDLKGGAMKLGQLLSLQGHSLPEDVVRELAQLQMRAPAMHPSLARAQFKGSLGAYPEDVYRDFETEPFAAASVGQVHRAITREGVRVAVKIQYPAIRAAIENDFDLLRSAMLPGRMAGYFPAALVEELRRGIVEETDYRNEAANLELFHRGLNRLPYLTIPTVHRELSSDRVITMSFVEGESLDDFLRRKPPQALRDLVGRRLLEMYYTQMGWLKAVHADHHPGNYLFHPDGRIGLVDFGCVKRIDLAPIVEATRRRAWRESAEEEKRVLALIFGAHTPPARARKFLPNLDRLADTLFPRGASPLTDFRDVKVWEALRSTSEFALREKLVAPEFAFLSRADLGLYHLLHRLGARVNIGEIGTAVSEAGRRG
ncbi:MAG: AarF/ABC1/UbiB kinase family protein [Verrucomicrobia bacterium]|nr:AarF/ABC1/UbiB kinase family protein [Verrucomicrobiota bacterium]